MFTNPIYNRTTPIRIIIVPGSKAKGNKANGINSHKINSTSSSDMERGNLNSPTSMLRHREELAFPPHATEKSSLNLEKLGRVSRLAKHFEKQTGNSSEIHPEILEDSEPTSADKARSATTEKVAKTVVDAVKDKAKSYNPQIVSSIWGYFTTLGQIPSYKY
jgi:hypothetical protein